jgi:predicted HAD superfamily phosphohydrolase YqeG
MFRRVPMQQATDLDEVAALVADAPGRNIVVFDADNTLVPQGAAPELFQAAVTDAVKRFEAMASVERVTVLTNGPERGVPGMVHRGNKPWTTRRRLGLDKGTAAVWVVGDQVLTDGVLAWRFGATYVQLVFDQEGEDSRQAAMRSAGRALAGMLFRSEPKTPDPDC